MSDAVFPTLPGLAWGTSKAPRWNTKVQKAASGREMRAAFMSYPLYDFKLSFEFLRADAVNAELQTIFAFFNARKGSFDSFLLLDADDNTATNQAIGTGDGVTALFTLTRTVAGTSEPVMNPFGTPVVKLDGVSTSAWTYGPNHEIVFNTAPAPGVIVTWSGQYYYRCRFAKDSAEADNFAVQLWKMGSVQLVGCLGNKV